MENPYIYNIIEMHVPLYASCVCNVQLARCVHAQQGWTCEIRYAALFTAAQSDTTSAIIAFNQESC